ncbi:MAG: hypothetical protein IPJ50_16490 [Betaproteobacteria bacterium]|nr:hypothetical protein [Betaproteobacteria bacterium]
MASCGTQPIAKAAGYGRRWRRFTGKRVFGLEHHSLSESPLANAVDLIERLPERAEVHLVSHSRGGLVGELIALSGCANLAEVLTEDKIQAFFAVDRSISPNSAFRRSPNDEVVALQRSLPG